MSGGGSGKAIKVHLSFLHCTKSCAWLAAHVAQESTQGLWAESSGKESYYSSMLFC